MGAMCLFLLACRTLGGLAPFGTLLSSVELKISVSVLIAYVVLFPLMNGARGDGCFIASVRSSIAAVILSSDDVFGIVTFVGENSIVLETLLPPVVGMYTS